MAKEQDLRLFVEAKPPNKLQYARGDVAEYLRKDLDFDAIAVLTDGIDWELWVRPQNDPLDDDYEPERTASLRSAISIAKTRNLENESYHPHPARDRIDTERFNKFTASAVVTVVREQLETSVDINKDRS